MGWIDDNKDAGAWSFTEQSNKPHYNEGNLISAHDNPVWSTEFAPVGDKITPTHFPGCGYWPRVSEEEGVPVGSNWWQQTLAASSDRLGMVAQYHGTYGENANGLVGVVYKDEVWKCQGFVKSIYIVNQVPNTCRLTPVYMAFFCPVYEWNWKIVPNSQKIFYNLYVFQSGKAVRKTTVWESNFATGDPYEAYELVYYNVMDCQGDRIACAAMLIKEGGVSLSKYQIKVSYDAGLTFPTAWTFPSGITDTGDELQLRMSGDGLVWIAYLRNSSGTKNIEVWKSNSGATSWSKVWEKDFFADLNNTYVMDWSFDVSNTDGQYIVIRLRGGSGGGTYYRVTYSSSNHGSSFTAYQFWSAVYNLGDIITANKQYIAGKALRLSDSEYIFMNSDDYGANFTENDVTGVTLTGFYSDQQKYYNKVVYAECGKSFYPMASSADYLSLLYSPNNGVSWSAIQTPLPNKILPGDHNMPWDGE